MRWRTLTLSLLLAGCEALPRDMDGISDRVAASRTIRVGIEPGSEAAAGPFLRRLGAATGARAMIRAEPLEPLVLALNDDRFDVIVARFTDEAAYATEIALAPPLDGSKPSAKRAVPRAAVRNGENRWLMTVERVTREGAAK